MAKNFIPYETKIPSAWLNVVAKTVEDALQGASSTAQAKVVLGIDLIENELSGTVLDVVAGDRVTVDKTDPRRPVVSATLPAGAGDVVGPFGATPGAPAVFADDTGKLLGEGNGFDPRWIEIAEGMYTNDWVGIGTDAPAQALDVAGGVRLQHIVSSLSDSQRLQISFKTNSTDGAQIQLVGRAYGAMDDGAVQIIGSTGGSDGLHRAFSVHNYDGAAWLPIISAMDNGFVGIGTEAPEVPLHVAGNIAAHGLAFDEDSALPSVRATSPGAGGDITFSGWDRATTLLTNCHNNAVDPFDVLPMTLTDDPQHLVGVSLQGAQGGQIVFGISPGTHTVDDGQQTIPELMVLKASGVLQVKNLPTSSAGLVAGDFWNNAGVVSVV